jgi:geranylgeranyl diphosphate synthase, type I
LIQAFASRYLPSLDTAMRQIVDSVPLTDAADFGVMLRYPLGWVDEHNRPYNHITGKRIRPILLLLCVEAVGGDWRTALPAASAVELLHNFSLIHDDIQDDSPTRHGRPTVWKIWGRANAINAGDALFSLAYEALQRLPITSEIAVETWGIFNRTNLQLTRGQHLDMRFEKQETVSVDEYLSMIRGKSAALISACAQMGALIGSGDSTLAGYFAEFGLNLGIAFQIRDDILGIWGDPEVTGKSTATDILARKKSLPVLYGLAQSQHLNEIYRAEPFEAAQVSEAVRLLDSVGALDYTQEQEDFYYHQALQSLEQAHPQGEAGRGLIGLAEFLFQRQH